METLQPALVGGSRRWRPGGQFAGRPGDCRRPAVAARDEGLEFSRRGVEPVCRQHAARIGGIEGKVRLIADREPTAHEQGPDVDGVTPLGCDHEEDVGRGRCEGGDQFGAHLGSRKLDIVEDDFDRSLGERLSQLDDEFRQREAPVDDDADAPPGAWGR